MIHGRRGALFALLVLSSSFACGKSGQRETRPAELLYRVSGVSGTTFRLLAEPEAACPVSGIQAANADHQFGDRLFTAPHFFILENALQPVRAAFEVPAGQSAIRVDLFVGIQPRQGTNVEPGQCAGVGSCGIEDPFCAGAPPPVVDGREVRIELCGSIGGIPSGARCGDFPDSFIGFFASLGDQHAANVTSCSTRPIAEACRTPATLFIEETRDSVSAVFDTLGTESPDAELRAELYIDGQLVESSTGKRNVQVTDDL